MLSSQRIGGLPLGRLPGMIPSKVILGYLNEGILLTCPKYESCVARVRYWNSVTLWWLCFWLCLILWLPGFYVGKPSQRQAAAVIFFLQTISQWKVFFYFRTMCKTNSKLIFTKLIFTKNNDWTFGDITRKTFICALQHVAHVKGNSYLVE